MTSSSDNHVVAQAVHDLGSALWFGGAVMGIAGVNKSGQDLSQGLDRIRLSPGLPVPRRAAARSRPAARPG